MHLGMIAGYDEAAFIKAKSLGLDFLEFCINGDKNEHPFFETLDQIRSWSKQYGIAVASVGRWKAEILDEAGNIRESEVELAKRLMDAAVYLDCPNYVCGCSYSEALTLYENCTRAIEFFSALLDYRSKRLEISVYNCHKGNFVVSPDIWRIVLGHLKDLGIKYDPSHPQKNGRDYLMETRDWASRFRHIHLKGCILIGGEEVDDPPAGLDQTNWPIFLSLLRANGYDGGLSIEPHSPIWKGELGDKGLEYTIKYFRSLML